jgi:PAS domain S-box-containing protein
MKDAPSGTVIEEKSNDQRQTVFLLKDYADQLACLVEMITEGIVILDRTGKIIYVNSAIEEMLRIGRNEIVGSNYKDSRWHFLSDDGGKAIDYDVLFGQISKNGTAVIDKEYVLENAHGKHISISMNAVPYCGEGGIIVGVVATITDVTERNRVKVEIRDTREVYDRLIRYADEAIFRTQIEDSKILSVNEAAERISGYSLAEYRANPDLFRRSILPEYYPAWLKALEQMKRGREAVKNMVLGITARDGRTVMLELTTIAVRNDKGEIAYIESLGRDITIHLFLERELAKSQKLEAIGLLAGGVAHDFNNILTVILGSLSLAKMEAKPLSRLFERISQAEDHCMKAKALTRRLLTYSRSGSPLRKTASLAQVLREATSFALSGKNIKCEFDLASDLTSALIDEGQMHQVIHYMVTNAAEAMPDGGTIEVGAQNLKLQADELPPLPAGNYVKWYIRDHGIGISKEHLKNLFDPYFSTKQMGSTKGVGLGLAICYSIIKSHEGLINVESDPGVGTTFTVYIPAVDEQNSEMKSNGETTNSNAAKHKILLIDDEKILLDVTSNMISYLGYEVVTASCHEDALDSYCKAKEAGRPFSVVIMDLTVRGNEGAETAIRKWVALHPEVRVIISSGYATDPVIEDYQNYGFIAAMVKPYTLEELKDCLSRALVR